MPPESRDFFLLSLDSGGYFFALIVNHEYAGVIDKTIDL